MATPLRPRMRASGTPAVLMAAMLTQCRRLPDSANSDPAMSTVCHRERTKMALAPGISRVIRLAFISL